MRKDLGMHAGVCMQKLRLYSCKSSVYSVNCDTVTFAINIILKTKKLIFHLIHPNLRDLCGFPRRSKSIPDVHQPPRDSAHWPGEAGLHTGGAHPEKRCGIGRGRYH